MGHGRRKQHTCGSISGTAIVSYSGSDRDSRTRRMRTDCVAQERPDRRSQQGRPRLRRGRGAAPPCLRERGRAPSRVRRTPIGQASSLML